MPIPANVFDSSGGVMPYGTSPVTCSNGETYIVNTETIDIPYAEAESQTSDGGPGQLRGTRQRMTYTGEWQLANNSTAYPAPGATFTRAVKNVTAAVSFVVLPGVPFEADNSPGSIRVIKVAAKEVIYTITTAGGLA